MKTHRVGKVEAQRIGDAIGVDWGTIDIEQFRRGLEVEYEHGLLDPETNITDDDAEVTGMIAWAHLKEIPDYYTRLRRMESEARAYWSAHREPATPNSSSF